MNRGAGHGGRLLGELVRKEQPIERENQISIKSSHLGTITLRLKL